MGLRGGVGVVVAFKALPGHHSALDVHTRQGPCAMWSER